jgi:hypothetical protein
MKEILEGIGELDVLTYYVEDLLFYYIPVSDTLWNSICDWSLII